MEFIIKNPKYLLDIINNQNLNLFDTNDTIQRNIDKNHLQDLIEYQLNYYKKYNTYIFPNAIILAKLNNKYAIIDGQHRIMTIDYLYKKNKNIKYKVPISIITLNKKSEYDDYFIAINKNKPVHLYKNINDWKSVIKKIENYFNTNYKSYLKKSNIPRIPNFNLQKLLEYIDSGNYIQKYNLTYQTLIDEIEKINIFYETYWKIHIQKKNYIKNIGKHIDKCYSKQPNKPFYLSIYKNFEWIDRIVYKIHNNIEYHNIDHITSQFRVKIPKKIRKKVWYKRNNNIIGKCFVCSDKLDYDDFECGHIISLFYGGKTILSNLEPICSICNKDMNIYNLYEWKNKYTKMNL